MDNAEKYDILTASIQPTDISSTWGSTEMQTRDFKERNAEGEYIKCPCCDKEYNNIYKRKLYPSIVKALIMLNRKDKSLPASATGDFAKLRHWGLIKKGVDKGHWIITNTGYEFLNYGKAIPEYVIIQNNKLIGYSSTSVTRDQVLL